MGGPTRGRGRPSGGKRPGVPFAGLRRPETPNPGNSPRPGASDAERDDGIAD